MSAYTEAEFAAAKSALGESLYRLDGFATSCTNDHVAAVLDAVAPAIAARALREAADDMSHMGGISVPVKTPPDVWLRNRADEIERT